MAQFYKMFRCIGAFKAEKELTGHTHCVNTHGRTKWRKMGAGDGGRRDENGVRETARERERESAEDQPVHCSLFTIAIANN